MHWESVTRIVGIVTGHRRTERVSRAYHGVWGARRALRGSARVPGRVLPGSARGASGFVRVPATQSPVYPGLPGNVVTICYPAQSVPESNQRHSEQVQHVPAIHVSAGQKHNRGQSQSVRGRATSPSRLTCDNTKASLWP